MKTNERGDPYTTGPVEDPQARAEAPPAQDSPRCMLSDMLIREEAERVANLTLRGRLDRLEAPAQKLLDGTHPELALRVPVHDALDGSASERVGDERGAQDTARKQVRDVDLLPLLQTVR